MTEELFKDGIREIDEMIAENQKMIDQSKAAQALVETEEWKLIIEKGYYEDEAERLPAGITNIQNRLNRDSIENMVEGIKAIRSFKQYISYKIEDGIIAGKNIDEMLDAKRKWAADYEEASTKEAMEDNIVDVEIDDSVV